MHTKNLIGVLTTGAILFAVALTGSVAAGPGAAAGPDAQQAELPEAFTEETEDRPLPPSIQPVMFLQGSDYDIGYQYGYFAADYIEAFSDRVWSQMFAQGRTEEEVLEILDGFQYYIDEAGPEITEHTRGMADGAQAAGYDVSYYDALISSHEWDIVAADSPAAEYPPVDRDQLPPQGGDGRDDEPAAERGCTALAAWGSATEDGELLGASSADGVFGPQVTLAVFPEEGNPMITTGEFGVWAWNYTLNREGLFQAIQFTATPERPEDEDYGLASTLSIYRIGRLADDVEEAGEILEEHPLTIGENYLFADPGGLGEVHETTADLHMVRESGDYDEDDFIISSNYRKIPEMHVAGVGTGQDRYEQLDEAMTELHGEVSLNDVQDMYATAPVARPRNRSIQLAEVTEDSAVSYISTGGISDIALERQVPIRPTNSFYRLEILDSPDEMTDDAQVHAEKYIEEATQQLYQYDFTARGFTYLDDFLLQAREEYERGINALADARLKAEEGDDKHALLHYSKAATAFTRAQAFANKVADNADHLGAGPGIR